MKSLPFEEIVKECEVLMALGDFEGILKYTDEILKSDPMNTYALSYRAGAFYNLERYAESLECLEEKLKAEPDEEYFLYFKVRVLLKLNRALEAYDFYKGFSDVSPRREVIESLAHALIDADEYEKALECLDDISETQGYFKCRTVDGYKRIANRTGMDLSGRYDARFYRSWIDCIKSKREGESSPVCAAEHDGRLSLSEKRLEKMLRYSRGARIECDDISLYCYICDKLKRLKEFLEKRASLRELHEEMDCLDDTEFRSFIVHLKRIGYIVEPSEGYIWDGDVMKKYCDEGKHAAPRWLAFPGYSPRTMGWRMGAGEQYCMNEPPREREFYNLFPQPKNWLFNPRNPKFKEFGRIPFLAVMWDDDLSPKYSKIGDDAVEVNGFITLDMESDFRVDALHFNSIAHAILFSKVASYNRLDPYRVTFEELENDFSITDEELAEWNRFRYLVCLNAAYYMFMQDGDIREKLLATGDKCLIYDCDDEWGGEENLFGFALMELRDEIRRLFENEELIDWKYTRYIMHAYPYINHSRDANDPQSSEYRVIESTLEGSKRLVRDANLDPDIAGKYEAGQIITEKAFVDASSRIGGMATTHRYLILSQFMGDLSPFEEDTNWGIHVARSGSRFKVLDIFTVEGKTQILLLHLPDGFEGVFKNRTDVEEEFIERERENFRNDLKRDVIAELASDEWLERCSFPVGMSDEGEFFND